MARFIYPARIEEIEGEYLVTFPDVPEALTSAETFDAAVEAAADALAAAASGYAGQLRAFPQPREPVDGEVAIPLEIGVAARVLLVDHMVEVGLTRVALAELIHRDEKAVRRILTGHGARLESTLDALKAVGVRPVLAA